MREHKKKEKKKKNTSMFSVLPPGMLKELNLARDYSCLAFSQIKDWLSV